MKRTLILALCASSAVFAQIEGPNVSFRAAGPIEFGPTGGPAVAGVPYSATITNETVQTLADGNRIVQRSTGATARDSMGRTRQDTALPLIGNMSAANAPHLVFIQDPVAKTAYTLNLTDKTANKMPPPGEGGGQVTVSAMATRVGVAGVAGALPPPGLPPQHVVMMTKTLDHLPEHLVEETENLGAQTMEGVIVEGLRTTRTIPAGEMGNDKPIHIVTEVWTSPELKTVVSSKRSDPRMGDQTFRLTNIVRSEPDASLFTVPADFTVQDGAGPDVFFYRQTK